jgi:hypothetical protein
MQKLTHPPAAPEMAVTTPPAAEGEPPAEDYATQKQKLEFDSGEQPVSFGDFGAPVTEITETAEEEEEEEYEEEEEEAEETVPRIGESPYASAGLEEIERTEKKPEAAAPPVESAAPTPAPEPAPETPQWGGIETPPRQPAPDEPPIPVKFESSEPLEIVREEAPPPPALAEPGPLPELAVSAQEFIEAATPAMAVTRSEFDDTKIMEPVPRAEIEAAARRAEERARRAAEAATAEAPVSPVLEEMGLAPPEPESAPPPEALQVEEAAAPPALAGAPALGYSALPTPFVKEAAIPPPPEPASPAVSTAEPEASTVILSSALRSDVYPRPMFTGNTDALARPRVDEGLVDAVADRVIEKIQGGILNKLTKDILRPIIEALIAQELDKKP